MKLAEISKRPSLVIVLFTTFGGLFSYSQLG
jgi:hypothetical protein